MSELGPFVSASQIEAAVIDVLYTWMHTYLGMAERAFGRTVGSMPRPHRSAYLATASEPLTHPDRQLPRVIVESPGWVEPPESNGQRLTATWGISVIVLVKGHDREDTAALNADFAAAVTQLLLHKTPELVEHVEVLDQNLDVVDAERERTFKGSEVVFAMRVEDVLDLGPGPDDPDPPQPPDPPIDYPDPSVVEETEVTVHRVAPDEEISP